MKRTILLFFIAMFVLLGTTQAQVVTDLDVAAGFEEVTFGFTVDADSVNVLGVLGTVSWDTTHFEYSDVDVTLDGSVINDDVADTEGFLKFAWASATPIELDSVIVTVVLFTKSPGSYEVLGEFDINEIPETFTHKYQGMIVTGLSGENDVPLDEFGIDIWPNPANPGVNVLVTTPFPQYVSIKMFDVLGKEVKVFYDGHLNDTARIYYNTDELSSGMYFFAIQGKEFRQVRTFTVLK